MIEAVNSDIRRQEYRLMAQPCPTLGPLVGSALELFDAKPLYPMYDLLKYREKDALYDVLENLTG